MDIPVLYDHNNVYTSSVKPGTIHARNTTLTWMFERYFTQRAFSVFEYTLPDNWDHDYFMYIMFLMGFGCVLNTDKYGIIFQHGTLSGYNVYYRPSQVLVSNPLLKTRTLTIGVDTEVIKLTPDYRGIYDLISYYADMAAVIMESFGINAINSKYSYVFAGDSAQMAASFKKMYDQVASGMPAVFVDKKMFDDEGKPRWVQFDQNVKQNFIGKDLLECMATIENMFDTSIGINNANYEKRERLLVDEVNANNQKTQALSEIWLEEQKRCFEKVNNMFGLNLSIKRRETQENELSNNERVRPVSV